MAEFDPDEYLARATIERGDDPGLRKIDKLFDPAAYLKDRQDWVDKPSAPAPAEKVDRLIQALSTAPEDPTSEINDPKTFIPFDAHPMLKQAFKQAWVNSGMPSGARPPSDFFVYGDPNRKYNILGAYQPGEDRVGFSRGVLSDALKHNDPAAYGTLVHELTHVIQSRSHLEKGSFTIGSGDSDPRSTYSLSRHIERSSDLSGTTVPGNANSNSQEYHASRSGRQGEAAERDRLKKLFAPINDANPTDASEDVSQYNPNPTT